MTFRDHGWGNRAWDAVLSHRWVFGVAGPEFSCCFLAWHGVDDSIAQFGWVVRGDKVTYTKSLDFVGYMDIDSIGNRGGHISTTLTTGEQLELEFTALVRPSVTLHRGIVCVDSLCKFTAGDLTGFANFETSSNPQHGTRVPVNLVRGILGDGWHD